MKKKFSMAFASVILTLTLLISTMNIAEAVKCTRTGATQSNGDQIAVEYSCAGGGTIWITYVQ